MRWFRCSRAARRARFGGRGLSVDDCVAALSGRVEDAHRSEAVGHLLGEAAVDRGGVGELGGVEERGQVGWKQAGGIVWAGEADALLDRDESAPGDDPAAAPERPAVAYVSGACWTAFRNEKYPTRWVGTSARIPSRILPDFHFWCVYSRARNRHA